MTFLEALKSIRGERTLEDFAASVGLHVSQVSRFENGRRKPSRLMLGVFYMLANTPEERAAIEQKLGGPPPAAFQITAPDRGDQRRGDKNSLWYDMLDTALGYADKKSVEILKNMLVYCSDQGPKKTSAGGRRSA